MGGLGEDPRIGGTPGTGATGTQQQPGTAPGSGTDPGTDPQKGDGGTGAGDGKGKGKQAGGTPGGAAGGSAGGKPGGKAGGQAGGAQDAPPDAKPGNKGDDSILGDLAALASLITDPESLHKAKNNGNTGKGAQIGHKKGLISGWLGQLMVIGMVFMGRVKDLVKGIGNFFKRGYNALKNKIFGKVEQKAISEGLDQAGLVALFGQGADDAEAMLLRLEAGEMVAIPEKVTPQMLQEYRAAAVSNIEKMQGLNVINKDDAIATQSLRIQIIDILLGRMK